MEQLLEKQGDGEAGVNSEERWARPGRPALGPPRLGHLSLRGPQSSLRFRPLAPPQP